MMPLLALAVLSGCPHAALDGRGDRPDGYAQAVAAATREARRYDGLETVLFLRATLENPAFAEAREQQRAWLLLSSPADLSAAIQQARQQAADGHRLLVAAASDSDSRPDLSFDRDPWRLRLAGDAGICTPRSLTKRRPSEIDRALYPWITPWNDVWDAVFERDCGEALRLQVGGARGSAELVWE